MQSTIFLDIDGTIIPQTQHVSERLSQGIKGIQQSALPGSREKLIEWERAGHMIVLTTGRKECWRERTERELLDLGIFYDALIMNLGIGKRYLINDLKPNSDTPMAYAINLPRNEGISEVTLP